MFAVWDINVWMSQLSEFGFFKYGKNCVGFEHPAVVLRKEIF